MTKMSLSSRLGEGMESKDWFLLLLSIPLSVLANVATPHIQKLLAAFSDDRKKKQAAKTEALERMWEWFAENTQVYALYLLRSGIAIIRNVIALMFLGALFLFLQAWHPSGVLADYRSGMALACYVYLVLHGSHVFRHTYRLQYAWFKVREINKWPADFYFNPIVDNFPGSDKVNGDSNKRVPASRSRKRNKSDSS
ncbi:hypothetical protein [Micromonospora sp. C41]|uniref:hypothetical protein n=1 Tax=Micromonospora sp. C41 TaxID=2824878 RepID=UPI001B37EF66|nr:hypothetical protein [Micromonospora sp. C41]MBQ1062287.1 hypothetical protein [Micromonospora sp. C41]